MKQKGFEGFQKELDFETIHGALCFDGTLPPGREKSRHDLVPSGDGKFTNADGDIYERAIRRDGDEEDHYVLVEKRNVTSTSKTKNGLRRTA